MKIIDKIAKLIDVKSIVTITMTGIMAYMLVSGRDIQPDLLALYSTSYGAVITYFFTKPTNTDST